MLQRPFELAGFPDIKLNRRRVLVRSALNRTVANAQRSSLRCFVTYPRAGVSVRAAAGCGRVRAVRRRAVIRHFAGENHVLTVLAERHVDRISIERS